MKTASPLYRERNQSQGMGNTAQQKVGVLLYNHGFRVHQMPYKSPYDILLDDTLRVEVKCAAPCSLEVPTWIINFHRHNLLSEDCVDKYIIRLERVPYFRNAIHLLFDAPIETPTLKISLRSLLGVYAGNVVAFNEFCGRKRAGKPVANGRPKKGRSKSK